MSKKYYFPEDYIPKQLDNPSDEERGELLAYALNKAMRLEDFDNIVEVSSPAKNILELSQPGKFKNIKVGIIGGGISGLCSSFELRKLGFDITIFEANESRIGGRIYTHYFDKRENIYGELGAMRIPVNHYTTWHYINLFKLNTRPFVQTNENAFIYVRGERVRNDSKGEGVKEKIYPNFNMKPWEKNMSWFEILQYGLGNPILYMNRLERKESLQVKKRYTKASNFWSSLNIRQVMDELYLSEGAIECVGNVEPGIGAVYNSSYSEVMQDDYGLNFAFLYEIYGGMAKLPRAFLHSLMQDEPKEYKNISKEEIGKIHWKSGATVNEIIENKVSNKVKIIYSRNNQEKAEEFDYIICAIPFSSLRTVKLNPLFSSKKMQAIQEMFYMNAQKTLLLCTKRFWEEEDIDKRIVGGGSKTDLPISTIWYPSDHSKCIVKDTVRHNTLFCESSLDKWDIKDKCSPLDYGVLMASYNWWLDANRIGNLKDDERIEFIKRNVEEVHGLRHKKLDYLVEDYKTVEWGSEDRFYGAYCFLFPKQKELFLYHASTPEYNKKVFFAGEHTSAAHGWIQGALQSGMNAANSLVETCLQNI